ncbi:MAG: hypothetical protein JO086_01205 [Acidimicrobiia bacterium]|nr:hypothetical protein [Acidimicrobiia bacterium]
MRDLAWIGDLVTRLGRPPENVWLVALGLACAAPLLAFVVPRLARSTGMALAVAGLGLGLVATVHQQTMEALGLITAAVSAGFMASWSTTTVRDMVSSIVAGPVPTHTIRELTLTRAQSRSLDYLAMRWR